MGADFVFSAGTLYVAKVSLPHEQSVSGAIFNTMTNVRSFYSNLVSSRVSHAKHRFEFLARNSCWSYRLDCRFQPS